MECYVLFNQDGTVNQCYIKGIHTNIPEQAEQTAKADFDKYCTRVYKKGVDGTPEKIPPVLPTLEALKETKWKEIKAERDNREQSGVPYMGKVLDSDTLSVQRIAIAVQAAQAAIAAGQDFTLGWTCQDNTVLTMTAIEVIGIPVALAQYSNGLHETARTIRTAIDEASTVEGVEGIRWQDT